MQLPDEYTIQKFHQLAGYPKQKQGGRVHEAGCPLCREGGSWGKKRRLYFIVKENHIFCHNCGWTGNPIKFIQDAQGLTYKEIMDEAREYDLLPEDITQERQKYNAKKEGNSLPDDCINLMDDVQRSYHSGSDILKRVYDFADRRKLLTACNRPKTLWVSLSDYIHKNRLIIPFYNSENQIVFYQSRTVLTADNKRPKYLSKVGSDKSIFNINNVKNDLDKIFIFEGPIDACFVKNGIAIAGIQENSSNTFNELQEKQLTKYNFFDKIWVLDSQWQDRAARTKTLTLADQHEQVFIWPKTYGMMFKDFNDMALALGVSEIPYSFILKNTYTGLKARAVLANLNNT